MATDNELLPKLSGKWIRISISPNPIKQEVFNVGVGFIEDGSEQFCLKTLDTRDKLEYLLGEKPASSIMFDIDLFKKAVEDHGLNTEFFPSGFIVSEPLRAKADDIDDLLETLYRDTVTLG